MSNTDLTIVAAVSRPACLPNVLANFARQLHPARLLLVLNGQARGVEVPVGPWRVIECEGGTPARPRNFGLEWVKAHGGGMVAFWDDDDHYGPGYVTEVVATLAGGRRRVAGKVVRFVQFDDGVYFFARKQDTAFLGGTIAGWAEELPPIPDLPCHEDHEWCRELKLQGFELVTLSGAHYVYNRTGGNHAWKSTRVQMLYCYGPAFDIGRADSSVADGPLTTVCGFIPRASVDDVENELVRGLFELPQFGLQTPLG